MPKIAVAPDPALEDRHAGLCECGHMTSQWPTVELAAERIRQHRREHDSGELMEPLSEFRARHGLTVDGRGLAVFPDGAELIADEEDEEG